MVPPPVHVGDDAGATALARARQFRRLSRWDAARWIGVSYLTYCQWEARIRTPSATWAPALAAFTGADLADTYSVLLKLNGHLEDDQYIVIRRRSRRRLATAPPGVPAPLRVPQRRPPEPTWGAGATPRPVARPARIAATAVIPAAAAACIAMGIAGAATLVPAFVRREHAPAAPAASQEVGGQPVTAAAAPGPAPRRAPVPVEKPPAVPRRPVHVLLARPATDRQPGVLGAITAAQAGPVVAIPAVPAALVLPPPTTVTTVPRPQKNPKDARKKDEQKSEGGPQARAGSSQQHGKASK